MENALWVIVAIGIIANAYRSGSKYTSNLDFRVRLREHLKNAGVIFLAAFFLGSLLIQLELFTPKLIALYIADADSTTAPYIAASFVSLTGFAAQLFIGLSGLSRNRKGLTDSSSKEFVD